MSFDSTADNSAGMAPSAEGENDDSPALMSTNAGLKTNGTQISTIEKTGQPGDTDGTTEYDKQSEVQGRTLATENKNNNNLRTNSEQLRVKKGSLVKRKIRTLRSRMLLNKLPSKHGHERMCQMKFRKLSRRSTKLLRQKSIQASKGSVNSTKQSSNSCIVSTSQTNSCTVCNEQFTEKTELQKHIIAAHPNVLIIFCDSCGDTFLNDKDLQNHISTCHVESTKSGCERLDGGIKQNLREYSRKHCQLTNKSGIFKRRLVQRHLKRKINKVEKLSHTHICLPAEKIQVSIENGKDPLELKPTSPNECDKSIPMNVNETQQLKSPQEEPQVIIKYEDTLIESHTHSSNQQAVHMEESDSVVNYKSPTHENTDKMNYSTLMRVSPSRDSPLTSSELHNNDENSITNLEINHLNCSTASSPLKLYRTYLTKSTINSTEKREISNESEFCYMCKQIFNIIDQKYTKARTINSLIQCPLCTLDFSQKFLLKKHVANDHLNCECVRSVEPFTPVVKHNNGSDVLDPFIYKLSNQRTYECCHCPSISITHDDLRQHIFTFHEIPSSRNEELLIDRPQFLRNLNSNILQTKPRTFTKSITHDNTSSINCLNCSLRFITRANYIRHIKEYHANLVPKQNCRATPVSNEIIAKNPTDLWENNNFFSNIGSLKSSRQQIAKQSEARKTCKKCNQQFETVRELSEHFNFVHDDPMENLSPSTASTIEKRDHDWRCLHCSQRFKLLQSYIRHRYFIHNDESMVHICENCDKILTSVALVNIHICLNVTSWTCRPCNKSFPNGVAHRLHNNDKHMETPGPHICNICEKRFLTIFMLSKHEETSNCHFNLSSREPTDVSVNVDDERNRSNVEAPVEAIPVTKKPKKEYLIIEDMDNLRVLHEDVIVREIAGHASHEIKEENNSSDVTTESESTDSIYQCSLCRLYFMSKKGLKIHLNRAHTSAVEVCQLCYKMFSTGALIRHMLQYHLTCNLNVEEPVVTVKLEEPDVGDEYDLEKDTAELIERIGQDQLFGLCEYHRFNDQTNLLDDDSCCPECPLKFDSSAKYRRHHVQLHDKLCALCCSKFDTGKEAAKHKTVVHGSIACYVWFAYKVVAAIEDTNTFAETAKKIVMENSMEKNYSSDDDEQDFIDSMIAPLLENDEVDYEIPEIPKYDSNEIAVGIGDDAQVGSSISDSEDEPQVLVIVTEEDLEKYRDNIYELAGRISSETNIIINESIIKLWEAYVRDHL